MKKFAVVVDNDSYTAKHLEARNMTEAMNEAEKLMTEDAYIVTILEKTGKTERDEFADCKFTRYTAAIVNRKFGWHAADRKHSELPATWKFCEYKGGIKVWELETVEY